MEMLTYTDKTPEFISELLKDTNNTEFEQCEFINCNFSNGKLHSFKFIDCIFTNCNLSNLSLKHSQLNNVVFKGCKLMGINFGECDDFLFFVEFENCIMDYCSFVKKKMPKTIFKNLSLKNSDFTDSDLTKCVFTNCDFLNASFNKTVLKEADFRTAYNFSIDPEINNVKKAKFSFYNVVGLLAKHDIIIDNG